MIYDKKCPVCQIEFKTNIENKVYCCHSCANKGRYRNGVQRGNFDKSLEWTRTDGRWECPYNLEVSCTVRNCHKCGWNPDVAKARTEKYMEENNG